VAQFDLICLANSRKHGGRCVAGLRTDGAGWIRPVGRLPDGTLWPTDYSLNDYTEVGPLDVFRVGVLTPRPAAHQPENWVIDGTTWTLLARPMGDALVPVLKNAVSLGPELLRGFSDRVSYASLQHQNATASLALLAPDELYLYQQLSYRGKPQARGRFSLGTGGQAALYDLAITDPHWENVVIQQPNPRTLRQADDKFLVTISLGEPFGLECYRLIAAIIVLPPSLAAVF